MNRTGATVAVVGSLNMDIVVQAGRAPRLGETILGEAVHFIPGGKGANQAVAATRLGARSAMVGAVGRDSFGQMLRKSLIDQGVDDSGVRTSESETTGVASILLAEGDNSIIVVPGANGGLTPADVEGNRGLIEEADVLLLQLEIPMEAVEAAACLGRQAGKKVILNPAPARELPAGLLSDIDVITPNQSELELLTGISLDGEGLKAAMERLLERGAGRVVTTLGEDGTAILEPGADWIRLSGHRVKAVDTTGAGDAFNAGLACALAEGRTLPEAAAFANKAAALAVTRLGAQAGMPTREEVEGFQQ
ncbi:ribokinase [Salinithrix halophila]|uniref:Ribokinase n=1 Tax=Salinithrix halophila TaxID=1485204 RepID=A0ABV8JDV5_9BACL